MLATRQGPSPHRKRIRTVRTLKWRARATAAFAPGRVAREWDSWSAGSPQLH